MNNHIGEKQFSPFFVEMSYKTNWRILCIFEV